MSRTLRLRPEAQVDVQEAYRWYDGLVPGLGEEFLSELDREFASLLAVPEVHARAHRDLRRALLRRFPFAIFYGANHREVTVFAVMHTARDPAAWKKRAV